MENSDFEETRPHPVDPGPDETDDIHTTRPVQTQPEDEGKSAEDQAIPDAHETSDPDKPDLEATLPTPVGRVTYAQSDFEDTIPPSDLVEHDISSSKQSLQPSFGESPPKTPRTGRVKRRAWIFYGLLVLILIALTSGFLGYQSGINRRKSAEATQVAIQVEDQFALALGDMEAKRYDLARQRFEYVIQLNPNYPGVTEKLAEVILRQNSTATPTIAPTPTITPTPDLRGVEELFQQAQQDLANYNWSAAIDTLLALRKADITYQPVWVDDMLYVSFRNRGVDKILKEGELEGGIYDLTLAERFGPLDADASGYQIWARLYITGASFWELDWSQAVYYFAQVAPALPNLRDGSGWTATERYRLALIGYGGQLADAKEWCAAQEQYELALEIGDDPQARETLDFVAQKCSESKQQPEPQPESPEPTPTPGEESTPTQAVATETQPPAATPTPSPSEEPTATPGS